MTHSKFTAIQSQASLVEFFRDALDTLISEHHSQAADDTIYYMARLLDHFAQSDNLYSYTHGGKHLPTLTSLYEQALLAPNTSIRANTLRHLGDVALFISGCFGGWFERRSFDSKYFVGMGEAAYSSLACTPDRTLAAWGQTFAELAEKFALFAAVLGDLNQSDAGKRLKDRRAVVWPTPEGSRTRH